MTVKKRKRISKYPKLIRELTLAFELIGINGGTTLFLFFSVILKKNHIFRLQQKGTWQLELTVNQNTSMKQHVINPL